MHKKTVIRTQKTDLDLSADGTNSIKQLIGIFHISISSLAPYYSTCHSVTNDHSVPPIVAPLNSK